MKNYKLLFLFGISTCFSSAVFSSDSSGLSLARAVDAGEAESYSAENLSPVVIHTEETAFEKKSRYSAAKIKKLRNRAKERAEAIANQTKIAIDKQDKEELQGLFDFYGFEAICDAWNRGFVLSTKNDGSCCYNIFDYASELPDSDQMGRVFYVLSLALAQEAKAAVDGNSGKYSKFRLKKLLDGYSLLQINTALKWLGINDILEYAVVTLGLDNQTTLLLLQHYTGDAVDHDNLRTIKALYGRYGAEHINRAWHTNKPVLRAAWPKITPTQWCACVFDYAFDRDKEAIRDWLIGRAGIAK